MASGYDRFFVSVEKIYANNHGNDVSDCVSYLEMGVK